MRRGTCSIPVGKRQVSALGRQHEPEPRPSVRGSYPAASRLRKVMLASLRDSRRAGPQPVDDEITAIALLGDAVIDLRGAKPTSKEITIRAYDLLNDVDVIVPEGVAVELSGVAVVGDNRNMTRPVPAGTGRFVVKIHGHAVLGDVQYFTATRAPFAAGAAGQSKLSLPPIAGAQPGCGMSLPTSASRMTA